MHILSFYYTSAKSLTATTYFQHSHILSVISVEETIVWSNDNLSDNTDRLISRRLDQDLNNTFWKAYTCYLAIMNKQLALSLSVQQWLTAGNGCVTQIMIYSGWAILSDKCICCSQLHPIPRSFGYISHWDVHSWDITKSYDSWRVKNQ